MYASPLYVLRTSLVQHNAHFNVNIAYGKRHLRVHIALLLALEAFRDHVGGGDLFRLSHV